MTTTRITPTSSVHTTAAGDHAFDSDSPAGDTLIVEASAFLVAEGAGAIGAFLAATGAWTVTVNGSIVSTQAQGIFIADGNTGISNIKIGAEGEVGSSADNAISSLSSFKLTNLGIIAGSVGVLINDDGGTHTITNAGTIRGSFAVQDFSLSGSTTVTNYGTLDGNVLLGGGDDVFTNFKTVGGVVKSGTVLGTIDLGAGNNTFNGGAKAEQLQDNDGATNAFLGGGDDTFLAAYFPAGARADGDDFTDAKAGIDTYDASGATAAVLINLDSTNHNLGAFAGAGLVVANTAQGDNVSGDVASGLTDSIFRFENAVGGAAADTIYGSGAINTLNGNGGIDSLFGFAGNDVLFGGAANDFLAGGAGKDMLTGDSGSDTFAFLARGDSGTTAASRDVITDFEDGVDKISLSAIDANATTTPLNELFDFIGTNVAFNGVAGELRAYFTATGQIIEGDVDGDGAADFSIKLADADHSVALADADFLL